MSDRPLFQNTDEQEAAYTAERQARVQADEGTGGDASTEPPAAAPVANLGNAPSAAAAPPGVDDVRGGTVRPDVGPFGSDPDDDDTRR